MKKLKKFKRFDKGGLTDSSGNPVLSGDGTPVRTMEDTETPEEKYAKRREGYEDIKNFFMGRRSKDEPSAPIEEREPPKKAAEEGKAPTRAAVKPAEPAKTERVGSPPVQSTAVNRGETSYDYPTQRESKRDDYEGGASPTSGGQTFKRAAPKPVAPKPKPPAPAAEKTPAPTPAAPAKAPRAARPEDIPGTDVKTPYKGETIDNSNLAAKQFAQSTLGATAAGRTLGAGARGAIGLGRMFESATKPEGKGTGKFPEAKPEIQVSTKPAVDRVKDAKIEGPPKPPRQETPAEKMGVRETSAMEKTRKANEVGPPDLGARARRVAEDAAKDTKQGEEVMAAAGRRATQNRADQKQAADVMAAANKRARDNRADQKQAADVMAAAGARAKQNRAENKQASDVMAAAKKRANTNRAQQRSDKIPQKDREPGYMQEYIAGRAEKRNRIKDLPDDGLSVPRYDMKKGGKIPAFKKGGLVGRADGCAVRGKTKGRMV